ncbi:hypothetical protein [Synechococcus lacustris]|nr:hypothetical protein [Synechococcus lacustris]
MLLRISRNVQGRCCKPQAEIFQAKQSSAESFCGDRAVVSIAEV